MIQVKKALLIIIIFFYNATYVGTFASSKDIVVLDSVEVDRNLLQILDSMILSNRYYANLHPTDQSAYLNNCFELSARIQNTGIEFGLYNLHHLDKIDNKYAYFRRDEMLFFVEKKALKPFIEKTRVSRLINKTETERRGIQIKSRLRHEDKDYLVDNVPGVYLFIKYDKITNSFNSVTDASIIDIFEVVDENPRFPNGTEGLQNYIVSQTCHIKVDKECRAVVKFIVEKDGTISNARIIKNDNILNDDIYIDIINRMPNWVPGKMYGSPCRTYITIPIIVRTK